MANQAIFVVYDGIHHSIFEGQVLAPLIRKLNAGLHDSAHIISFEEQLSPQVLATHRTFSQIDPRITLTLFKRPRFMAQLFLQKQAWQLKKVLETTQGFYQLIARGPLAGTIAKKSVTNECRALTLQARGLLAQEHAYTHRTSTGLRQKAHQLRTWQLSRLEKNAYTPLTNSTIPFFIEAVSPALCEYLVTTYQIPASVFCTPPFDAPEEVPPLQKTEHRRKIRTALAITDTAPVYVYNGSLKAWQCPRETIETFKERLAKDSSSIFLALTQDQDLMRQLLNQAKIPSTSYRVLHISQAEVVPYLCTADYGILFREPHPLNWVSRPTKLLEYQAAGLEIIHNHTIELLSRSS